MRISREVVRRLDLEKASKNAAARGNDFFPSLVALRAAEDAAVRDAFRRRWVRDFSLAQAAVVVVPKFGGATRPATDMDAEGRVLFDALCDLIDSLLPKELVNQSLEGAARSRAEDTLANGTHSHVLVTDIVAFYEYVDRDVLASELEDLTGDADVTEALSSTLLEMMPNPRGLPQGTPRASVLGDVYLSIADRRLARGGHPVFRWADDYRFPANSLRDATRLQVELEAELRGLGLVISSAKTWTPTIETYRAWVVAHRAERTALDELIAQILEREHEDYATPDDEDGDGEESEEISPDPILERNFREATDEDAPWGSSPESFAANGRLRVSLRELGRTGSTVPLERLGTLLYRWPHLTRQVASYLRARMFSVDESDVVEAVSGIVADDDYPHKWQLGWLIHALIPAKENLPKSVVDRALELVHDTNVSGFVRGRAAVLLGTEGELPLGPDLAAMFDSLTTANRPDIVVAASLMPDSPDRARFLNAVAREPLFKAVSVIATTASAYHL